MIGKAFLMLVVLAALVLAAQAALATGAYEEIRALRIRARDYTAAIDRASKYLKRHSKFDNERQKVHYELGAALYAAERYDETLTAYRQLVGDYAGTKLDASAADFFVDDALYWIGMMQQRLGKRDEATTAYRKVVDRMPPYGHFKEPPDCRARAMLQLGEMYAEKGGQVPGSYALYLTILEQYPKSKSAPVAKQRLAQMADANRTVSAAMAVYADVCHGDAVDMYSPAALLLAARTFSTRKTTLSKQLQEANAEYVWACVGTLFEHRAKSREASKALEVLMDFYWEDRRDSRADVQAVAERVFELYPDSSQASAAKLKVAWFLANWKGSEKQEVREYAGRITDDVVRVSVKAEDFAQYEKAFEQKISVLNKRGAYAEARKQSLWFLERYGDRTSLSEELHGKIPYSYFREKNYKRAAVEFEKLVEKFPDAKSNYVAFWKYWVGLSYMEHGDPVRAKAAFLDLKKTHPNDSWAKSATRRIDSCNRQIKKKAGQ